MRYLRLCEVFNRSGKCALWDTSSQGNICRAFVWPGKCPSGMCLVAEMTVGHSSGRGCVWSGKCPSGMCLVGEVSVGDVSGRRNVCRGSVRRGRVRRGNVRRGCVWESFAQGRSPLVTCYGRNFMCEGGRSCPTLVVQRRIIQGKISWGQKFRKQLTWREFHEGQLSREKLFSGNCPGSKRPGGNCPGENFMGSNCPGGSCPGGECPDTKKIIIGIQSFSSKLYEIIIGFGSRGVFRTQSNTYEGAFCENSRQISVVNYFCKKLHLSCFIEF